MTSTLLDPTKLSPHFSLPEWSIVQDLSSSLLLGQQRLVEAFALFSAIPNQHLYLADSGHTQLQTLMSALVEQQGKTKDQYLVGSLDRQSDSGCSWQNTRPDSEPVISQKTQSFRYLTGSISRSDLLGSIAVSRNTSADQAHQSIEYQAGALAKCHYLFICATSLFQAEGLWLLLRQILTDGEYKVNHAFAPMPLNCNIVLVGDSMLYSQLYQEDSAFQQFFPLLGEVIDEISVTPVNLADYCLWLQSIAIKASVSLAPCSMLPLLNYGAQLCEHQLRLSLASGKFFPLFYQARALKNAQVEDGGEGGTRDGVLDGDAINAALAQLQLRHNASELYSWQHIDDDFISLFTSGEHIGQITALTVIDTVDYRYGEPARVTATVHYGDGELADIERKSELAGNIHAKGMMILSACLYRVFGRDAPLHLNASIAFEQSYQEIDGDSASLAEYCCLLSAIAERPINQAFAVTGALDQFGNVQAIGGVNEKIDSFFRLCQRRELTGLQGVLIPKSNALQLNLSQDVIQAVTAGTFKIYTINHIDDAIALLMNCPAGVADSDNDFAEDSLYGMVQQRLNSLAGYMEKEPSFFEKVCSKLNIFSR